MKRVKVCVCVGGDHQWRVGGAGITIHFSHPWMNKIMTDVYKAHPFGKFGVIPDGGCGGILEEGERTLALATYI